LEKISGIYCIENMINHKKYIGQSVDINKRLDHHARCLRNGYEDCLVLKNAWNKYGEENFKFYILEECSIELLDEHEIKFIKELHSHVSDWGYNVALGGNVPMRGRKHTEESKKIMSEAKIGWIPDEEWRKKRSDYMKSDLNPFRGKKKSEESIRKTTEKISGENNYMYGKHWSEDTKKKISKANKGKIRSEEVRQKLSEIKGERHWAYGKKFSQEIRDNISNCLIGTKKNGSSKYSGVSFSKPHNKWKARITYNRKELYIGIFETEIEAALAYNQVADDYYGYKGKRNIISQDEINNIWSEHA
jgi:group I intron endonuclease